MSAGVSTLNNYTKNVLMVGPRRLSALNPCSFNFFLPPYYTPASTTLAAAAPPSPPRISHLSPYYEPPTTVSTGRLAHLHPRPLPFHHSESFPPHPSHAESSSPFHRLSLPSQPSAPAGPRYGHEEVYSPL